MQRREFNRYLTEREEKQLFQFLRQFGEPLARRDYAWMRLARQTGIRVTPLSRLTCGDAREAIHGGRLYVRPETNKGGRGYTVYCTRKAKAALLDLLSIRRELGYAEDPEQPLIMSRNHRGMSVRSFQERMRKWCLAAGLGEIASPHWWRHTLAKRVMARSAAKDPRGITQHVLGHADIRSTAVYTGPDKEDLVDAMEAAS